MKKNLNVRFTAAALALLMSGAPIGLQAKAATSVDSATTTEADFDYGIESGKIKEITPSIITTITANVVTNINIVYNNKSLVLPLDANGKETSPKAIDGKTILPISAFEQFGLDLEWDNETKSVYITSSEKEPLIQTVDRAYTTATTNLETLTKGYKVYIDASMLDNENDKELYERKGVIYNALDHLAYAESGRIYIEARDVMEFIGQPIGWNQADQAVYIGIEKYIQRTEVEYDGIKKPYYPNDSELQAKIDELYTYLPLYKPYDARIKELLNKLNKIETDYGVEVEDLEANPNIPEEAKEYLKLADKGLAGFGNRWLSLNFNYNNYEGIKGAFLGLDQEMGLLATYDDPKRVEDTYYSAKWGFIHNADAIINHYKGLEEYNELGIEQYLNETDAFIITQSQLIEGYIWQAKNIINGNKSVSNQYKNIKTFIKRI